MPPAVTDPVRAPPPEGPCPRSPATSGISQGSPEGSPHGSPEGSPQGSPRGECAGQGECTQADDNIASEGTAALGEGPQRESIDGGRVPPLEQGPGGAGEAQVLGLQLLKGVCAVSRCWAIDE